MIMPVLNRKWVVLVVVLAGVLVAGCGRRDSVADGTTGDKILHLANSTEPSDLDPQTVTGRPESTIIRTLIEGLVIPDPVTLAPRPGQAESWEISADGRVYTFHLRPDARWSNGDPVTTRDFVGSWRRILTPSLGSEYAYNLFIVEGAEDFNNGRLTDFAQTGFRALDDRTLQVTLRHPTSYFLSLLVHYSWHPVHLPTVEKFGGLERKGTRWTRPENYVGNGPFVLTEWRPNQYIALRPSPTYWGRDQVKLDEVRFYAIESVDTEERMFRTGQLHITRGLPLNKIEIYRREHQDVLRVDSYLATAYYRVNTRKAHLADARVRRALALSVDRVALAQQVLQGTKTPAYTLTPPGTLGFDAGPQFPSDIPAAQALLAEAGFPGGQGMAPIEILYPSSDNGRIICEALQQMWRKNLGIDVRLYNQEWKVYLDTMNTGNYDLAWSAWIGDYVDPMTFLDMQVTDGGNNRTGWSNSRYDELVAEVQTISDDAQRLERFAEMERMLGVESPVIPLYHYANVYLLRPEVKGWNPNLLDIHPLQAVWLEAVPSP